MGGRAIPSLTHTSVEEASCGAGADTSERSELLYLDYMQAILDLLVGVGLQGRAETSLSSAEGAEGAPYRRVARLLGARASPT